MITLQHCASRCFFWTILISVLGLAGCASKDVRLVPICVDQYQYTPQQQQALADEREAYRGKYPMTDLVIGNYADVRTQNQICVVAQRKYFQKWGTPAPGLSEVFKK